MLKKENDLLNKNDKIILGIDPSIVSRGYGVMSKQGNNLNKLKYGILKPNTKDNKSRLGHIFGTIIELIAQYSATEIAIEAPFFGVNAQSTLKLGKVLGVVYGAAFHKNVSVTEYMPRKVKLAITGNGNATKEQVARMVLNHLGVVLQTPALDDENSSNFDKKVLHNKRGNSSHTGISCDFLEKNYDATDALAVAICHCLQRNNNNKKSNSNKKNSWKSFIENNPERI